MNVFQQDALLLYWGPTKLLCYFKTYRAGKWQHRISITGQPEVASFRCGRGSALQPGVTPKLQKTRLYNCQSHLNL